MQELFSNTTQKMNFKLAIIIPCFNEFERLNTETYKHFITVHEEVLLCFVNDGSNDSTIQLLNEFKERFPNQIFVIDYAENQGKSEAVRIGFTTCLSTFKLEKLAYLDADLSTTLEECVSISQQISTKVCFAFGSRILTLNSDIRRKPYRFLIGRIIATLISKQLKLNVYDTQCGCKVFDESLAKDIFKKEFISRWLFDVEIFHRLMNIHGRNQLKDIAREIPLKSWIDTDDSKVPFSYFFKLWYDLYVIGKTYKTPLKTKNIENEILLK